MVPPVVASLPHLRPDNSSNRSFMEGSATRSWRHPSLAAKRNSRSRRRRREPDTDHFGKFPPRKRHQPNRPSLFRTRRRPAPQCHIRRYGRLKREVLIALPRCTNSAANSSCAAFLSASTRLELVSRLRLEIAFATERVSVVIDAVVAVSGSYLLLASSDQTRRCVAES